MGEKRYFYVGYHCEDGVADSIIPLKSITDKLYSDLKAKIKETYNHKLVVVFHITETTKKDYDNFDRNR